MPADAVDPWVRSMATTFLEDRASPHVQSWIERLGANWQPERAWGARDRGRWVATLRTEPRRLTVPGSPGRAGEVPVDALTNVTVAATHRRRGLMSRMLSGSLLAARERGDVLSVLIAAEWPIYGRFGYAPATLSSDDVLRRSRPGARCPGDPAAVRDLDLPALATVAPEVFDRARLQWAGQMDRSTEWWQRNLGLDGRTPGRPPASNWFVHEGADGIDGVLGWSPHGEPNLQGSQQHVEVQVLVSAGEDAYRDLWSYLSSLDLVDEVRLSERPVSEPVRWLLEDGRSLLTTRQVDFLWLRLLDLPAALRARTYAIPGELVLEVIDPDAGGFAAGRYRLLASSTEQECEPTGAEPDLEISQRTLASIYLGGFRLRELALAGGVRELKPGALSRADLMFSSARPPWNPTWF